jgi:hypothetical protein
MEAPELSKVSAAMRRRVALAEIQGWTWRPYEWWTGKTVPLLWDDSMGTPSGDDFMFLGRTEARGITSWFLPDPERDPTALGALIGKEEIGVCPPSWGALGRWSASHATAVGWQYADTLGRAVMDAVLAKYASGSATGRLEVGETLPGGREYNFMREPDERGFVTGIGGVGNARTIIGPSSSGLKITPENAPPVTSFSRPAP